MFVSGFVQLRWGMETFLQDWSGTEVAWVMARIFEVVCGAKEPAPVGCKGTVPTVLLGIRSLRTSAHTAVTQSYHQAGQEQGVGFQRERWRAG